MNSRDAQSRGAAALRTPSYLGANAVRLWGMQNPDFFRGTVVARQAAEVLARTPALAAAEQASPRSGGLPTRPPLRI